MKLYVKGTRLAWAQSLFVAKAKADDPLSKAKYQGTFIVEPTTLAFAGDANPDTPAGQAKGYKYLPFKDALGAAIQQAANEKFGARAATILAQLKAQNRLILHDGAEKGEKPGYVGNLYFNAANELRPLLLNAAGGSVQASDGVLYGGCYVTGVFDVWAGPGAKKQDMVGISLLGVQFMRDGERLGGGLVAAADDFAAIPSAEGEKAAAGQGAAGLFPT